VASSRRKQLKPDPPPPVFFCDRSLGRYGVPDAVRSRGYETHTLWSVYGDDLEEQVPDEVWIEDNAKLGRILLAKDDIRYTPPAKEAMIAAKARVFFLSRQDLKGPVQIAWFMTNLDRIIQRARRPGPYAYAVYEDTIIKRFP
jgi:hypothetical protein